MNPKGRPKNTHLYARVLLMFNVQKVTNKSLIARTVGCSLPTVYKILREYKTIGEINE